MKVLIRVLKVLFPTQYVTTMMDKIYSDVADLALLKVKFRTPSFDLSSL